MKEKIRIIPKADYSEMANRFGGGKQPPCHKCNAKMYFHHAGKGKPSSFNCPECGSEIRSA